MALGGTLLLLPAGPRQLLVLVYESDVHVCLCLLLEALRTLLVASTQYCLLPPSHKKCFLCVCFWRSVGSCPMPRAPRALRRYSKGFCGSPRLASARLAPDARRRPSPVGRRRVPPTGDSTDHRDDSKAVEILCVARQQVLTGCFFWMSCLHSSDHRRRCKLYTVCPARRSLLTTGSGARPRS